MSFWEQSWVNIDLTRVQAYTEGFDFGEDEIIKILKEKQRHRVLDAGCGCGIYALKLAKHGFYVDGFDVAVSAAGIARKLMTDNGFNGKFVASDIKDTGLASESYDAVISLDVIDHMTKKDARHAMQELLRLTKKDSFVIVTVDSLDEEYVKEPHIVDDEGNYCFTEGKWNGMVFHPYDENELHEIIVDSAEHYISTLGDGFMLVCRKYADNERV